MAYALVLSAGLQTSSEIHTTFVGLGGDAIEVSGTAFVYDEDGYLKAGTIKKITYMDRGFGTLDVAQTVTVKNLKAADLYQDLLSPAIGLIKQTSEWSTSESITSSTSKKIVLEMDNSSQVVITGTGFGLDPTDGKVSAIEHLDSSGSSLDKLSGLNVSLAVALTALGQSYDIYDYLTQGNNTVTNVSDFPPRLEGGLGNDTLKGGPGPFNVAEYVHTAVAGIHADLGTGKVTGGAGNDKLVDIDAISGSNFNDTLIGRDKADVSDSLYGNGGKDTISGLAGNDFITGDAAADRLSGGAGDDRLDGGAGNDILDGGAGKSDIVAFGGQSLDPSGVTIHLDQAGTQDFGGWGKDSLKGFEGIYGSGASDHIFGSKGDNLLIGSGGADVLKGMDGNDTLYGDIGPGGYFSGFDSGDTMDGGGGNDTINTSAGPDVMIGGTGRDTFVFNSLPSTFAGLDLDKIKDFKSADDTMTLQHFSFDDLEVGKLSKDAFVLGTQAQDAEDRIVYDKSTGNLYFDPDGKDGDEQVLFTVIINKADIDNTDFVVF